MSDSLFLQDPRYSSHKPYKRKDFLISTGRGEGNIKEKGSTKVVRSRPNRLSLCCIKF